MTGTNALILIAAVASTDPVPDGAPEAETPSERWKKFSESEHHIAGSVIGASLATIAVLVPTLAVAVVAAIPAWFDNFDWCSDGTAPCSRRAPKPQPPLMSNSATYGLIVFALGSITFVPYAAWLGHSFGKGKGDGRSAFLGSTIGTAVTVALVLAAGAISRENVSNSSASNAAANALLVLGAVAPSAGAVIGLERSHTSQAIPRVGFVPTKGGGQLSLSWSL